MHNETEKSQSKATGFKRFSGWAGGVAALLMLAAGVIMGANPDKPGPQVVANEAYTLVLTASPDVTQVAYGESVTFTATVRCNDPDGPATNVVRIEVTAGQGDDASGIGSASTTVMGDEHGPNMIAVTASDGGLTNSRSIDVIRVTVGAGSTDCVHTESAQMTINTNLSYSPAGYDWSNAPSGLDPGTGDGETFEYFPSASEPGIYKVTATSKNLERCHDETHAVVIKVDLDAEGCVCVTNGTTDAASRKQITVNKCAPASWDGHVTLLWEGGVKVYTAASDGVEVASGTTFANEHLPTNFWVEGTAPSTTAGDVVFRLNPVEVSCPNAEEGCDRATMTVVRVDVDVDGLAESAEETVPGGVVCVTNHPNRAVSRKQITVQRAEPTDWDGEVKLAWDAANVKLFTALNGTSEVTSGVQFQNANLPTNLWVEGTAASATAGDVILKVTPVGVTCNHADTGCDWARMTMILVDVDVDGLDDPVEEDAPGAFVCVTNGPGQTVTRKQITVQQVEPTDWDGEVKLDWSAGKIKVYTASNNGVEVTSGNTFANEHLPTNFWVAGTAPSATAGDVIFRLNPVGASCPHAATGCDRVVMSVIKVDLEIYKPKVVDAAEPMIPEADELSKGSVTFVNLDNDDNDSKFDHGGVATDDEVAGGDDELIKMKLKIRPHTMTNGTVKLLATLGAGNIAVWTNDNKAASSAYALGTVLNVQGDFAIEGDSLVKTMWVEGVSAHTIQQGTNLKMEYTLNGTTCIDEAALTVVGVDKITWKGKGNSLNDDDDLTEDTNWLAGLPPGALRVFPGARAESGTVGPARDKVTAEVMLTVKPPYPIKLYLKSFDTDDPTADSSPVDDETNEDDNRGMSPAQAGQFTGESGGVLELVFPENVKTTNCEFQVTMQPGDNFRIVANGDKDFLSQLENKDSTAGATDADKQRICNKDVTGTPEDREVRLSGNYASDVLTVWRFLHVEVDSMAAPPTTGAEKNFVDGNLTAVVGNGTVAQRVNLTVNLRTGLAPQDNSRNLDSSPSGNGRFENGWIKIGSGGGTPGQKQTSALLGNGDDYVRKDAGVDIPARVSKAGQSNVSGKVIAWSGSAFTLSVSSGTLSTNYSGGTLNVAGVSATITTVRTNGGVNVVNVSAAPTIPFVLHDDDDNDSLLPHVPMIGTEVESLYKIVYIKPVPDGGGNINNNTTNVTFVSNAPQAVYPDILANAMQSDGNRSERYWVAYVLSGFQSSATPEEYYQGDYRGDCDSNLEGPLGGVCVSASRAMLFMEEMRDNGWLPTEERTIAHEIGHEFGLEDRYGEAHLMGDCDTPGLNFRVEDQESLRRGPQSPGRR